MANATSGKAVPAWSQADEDNFNAMKTRRDAAVGAREAALQSIATDVWSATMNRGPDALMQADRAKCVGAIVEALKLFANPIRAALEPFDNGPAPAADDASA